jgi:hypothetical protein
MVTCELMGGLGNQLFQIATTIGLGLRNNDKFVFDISNHKIGLQGFDAIKYKNNIYSKLVDYKFDPIVTFNEVGHYYSPIPYQHDMKIVGYFQSEKYFSDFRSDIINIFKPTEEIKNYITDKYGWLFNIKTCSLHVRHGDYMLLPSHHPPLQVKYYLDAIKNFDNNTKFLIFSDDIEWCKTVFLGDRFIFIENENDYIDLYLMSMCNNNITANSSFSWWGSWLNTNPDKIVIAPSKWFGLSNQHLKTDDIYTDKMIII